LYPEHPESEHRWRLDRARRIMEEDNLDVLILARNVNVFYMTGSRFVFVGKDWPVTLSPQSTAIITQEADIYCQRFGPFDSDEVPLHTTLSEQLELYNDELELVNILKDYGIGRGARIGTEWGPGLCVGINPIKFLTLKKRVEDELGAEIVDATSTIWKMTAVKSKLEIERMKVAVAAAARAMERVYDVIELGMNELDVARMVSTFMLEEGADSVTHAQVMAEGVGGLSFRSCSALDRPVERGWVHLDIGCKYKRYGSDINRGVFLGRGPTPEEQKLYECRLGVNELMDRIIKPGVSMDYVLTGMKRYVEGRGCVLSEVGGSLFGGHGIGLESYQHPNLVPSVFQPEFQNEKGEVLFEAGMMFTYEMAVESADPSVTTFFNIEDDVVVTETGVENMNGMLSRNLRVRL
jgi:Xaa-Pro aminopeptidase